MNRRARRSITLALLLAVVGLFSLVSRAPAQDDSLTFMVLGDTRSGHAAHQSVVDKMLELGPPPFYLHTGDLVEDGSDLSQWDTFLDIEGDLMEVSTLYPVMGGDLAGTSQPWRFVFFHIPPYSSGGHGSNLDVRQALGPLFEQYGVAIVFNGHDHDYERSVANGVTYIVAGGGGAPLYQKEHDNPASVHLASVHHFVRITLSGDTLSGVAIEPDGTEFDPFTIVLGGAAPTATLTRTMTPTFTRTPTGTATPTGTPTATGTTVVSDGYPVYLPLIMKAYSGPVNQDFGHGRTRKNTE
jgi:hypothetical protein